jgi:hypothetical protein
MSGHSHKTLCQYEYNISNGQNIVSNIYNNNKASNAKIGYNVDKAVYLIYSCKSRGMLRFHTTQIYFRLTCYGN